MTFPVGNSAKKLNLVGIDVSDAFLEWKAISKHKRRADEEQQIWAVLGHLPSLTRDAVCHVT